MLLIVNTGIDPKTLQESKSRDIAIAINSGVVTSFSGLGEFHWQVAGAPTWALSFKHSTVTVFDPDAHRVDDLGQHDTVHGLLFIMGDRAISLVSRDGSLLSTSELPSEPISRPVFGDFDSDGVSDVIVITEDAILGFRLEVTQSSRGLFVAMIVLSIVAGIIFFSNIRTVDRTSTDSSVPRNKRNILTISRATDEYHID